MSKLYESDSIFSDKSYIIEDNCHTYELCEYCKQTCCSRSPVFSRYSVFCLIVILIKNVTTTFLSHSFLATSFCPHVHCFILYWVTVLHTLEHHESSTIVNDHKRCLPPLLPYDYTLTTLRQLATSTIICDRTDVENVAHWPWRSCYFVSA